MSLFLLFLNFLYMGVLSFGGGYAVLPLISQQCVEINNWITMTEFSVLITISDITPGPISIDAAAFVGVLAAGIPGVVVATLGFMLPPFIISSVLYLVYKKYGELHFMKSILNVLKPAVVGLVAIAALKIIAESLWSSNDITLAGIDVFSALIAFVTFVVIRKWKTGVIPTILCCGVMGVLWELVSGWIA